METLTNRQKAAEYKAMIIDEWIALNATACFDIPNDLENHLYEIALEDVEKGTITFIIDNNEYLGALLNADSLINLQCFSWIVNIKIDGKFDYVSKHNQIIVIFTIVL